MSLNVTIENNLRLTEVLRGVEGNLQAEIQKIAKEAKQFAQDFCPVDTGKMKRSISATTKKQKNGPSARITAKYPAPHVEFGTAKMLATPFLIPAVNMAGDNAIRRITRGGLL